MPKMDIGGSIVLMIMFAVWPLMPTLLIAWGYREAMEAQKLIDSLTQSTTGTVTSSGVFSNAPTNPDEDLDYGIALSIRLDYEVDGESYTRGSYAPRGIVPAKGRGSGLDAIAEKYVVGESYPLWYSPDNPSVAYLVKGSKWDHAGKMKWGIFILLGIAGMLAALLAISKVAK